MSIALARLLNFNGIQMNKNISILILFFLVSVSSLLLISCPDEVNPPEPRPEGVKLKAYTGATVPVETGLRPLEGIEQRIRIEWTPLTNNENNLIEEYFIYRSNGIDSPFVQIGNRLVDFAEEDSFYIDENGEEDVTYRYFVTARNSKNKFTDTSVYFGNSDFIKSIRLGRKVQSFISPPPDTANTKPLFTWCMGSQPPIKYIVKLATLSGQVIWIAEKGSAVFDANCNDPANHEYLTFHNGSYSANDTLQIKGSPFVTVHYVNTDFFNGGRLRMDDNYRWRIDCIYDGAESKSRWAIFTVKRDYINPN